MKRKSLFKVFIALFVSCSASVSAQTANNTQTNGSTQSKESFNNMQNYKMQQMAAHTLQPVPLANRVPVTAAKKSAAPTKTASVTSAVSLARQATPPVNRELLLIQKKQAAAKGLPTATYDKALNELNTNQAK